MNEPKIKGSIRHNLRRYVKGQEAELRAATTPEQRADMAKRGLIEGDWGDGGEGGTSATGSDEAARIDATRIEAATGRISAAVGIERREGESVAEYLERLADSAEAPVPDAPSGEGQSTAKGQSTTPEQPLTAEPVTAPVTGEVGASPATSEAAPDATAVNATAVNATSDAPAPVEEKSEAKKGKGKTE